MALGHKRKRDGQQGRSLSCRGEKEKSGTETHDPSSEPLREYSALTSMKYDISVLEPFLEDGDYSNLIPRQKVSYAEKLWGILPHNSAACLSLWNSLEYSRMCPFFQTEKDKSTMTDATRSPVNKRIWALLLVLILQTVVLIVLSSFYISCPSSQLAQVESDRIGDNPAETVLVRPGNLSLLTLLQAQEKEPPWATMRNCLDKAIQEFAKEPVVLQTDARMILQCNGTRQEFLSGEGGNVIEVLWIDGTVKYLVHEASPEVRVARLSRHPLPLNLATLERVRQDLVTQDAFEDLKACLDKVIQEFPREPGVVQNNAKLVVSCGRELTFIAGEGQTEITVYREKKTDEEIRYWVKATGSAWWARFFKRGSI